MGPNIWNCEPTQSCLFQNVSLRYFMTVIQSRLTQIPMPQVSLGFLKTEPRSKQACLKPSRCQTYWLVKIKQVIITVSVTGEEERLCVCVCMWMHVPMLAWVCRGQELQRVSVFLSPSACHLRLGSSLNLGFTLAGQWASSLTLLHWGSSQHYLPCPTFPRGPWIQFQVLTLIQLAMYRLNHPLSTVSKRFWVRRSGCETCCATF